MKAIEQFFTLDEWNFLNVVLKSLSAEKKEKLNYIYFSDNYFYVTDAFRIHALKQNKQYLNNELQNNTAYSVLNSEKKRTCKIILSEAENVQYPDVKKHFAPGNSKELKCSYGLGLGYVIFRDTQLAVDPTFLMDLGLTKYSNLTVKVYDENRKGQFEFDNRIAIICGVKID